MRKIWLLAVLAGLFATPAYADFTGKDASAATITFKNPNTCSSVVCVPIFSLYDPTGVNGVAVLTLGADAASNTANGLLAYSRMLSFNGTTWDRWQGAVTNAGTFAVQAAQSGTWNVTNISGTVSLPTGAATSALQTTGNTALTTINTTLGSPFQAGASIGNTTFAATQATAASLNATVVPGTAATWGINTLGSTTSGQSGQLSLGAVTTGAPTYSTTQTNALSLTTAGALRVDGSGVTQPVSLTSTTITGSVAATIATWAGGTLGAMANYGTSPGAVLVPGVNAFITNVPAVSQSGTWTVQPGNTPNTSPWLFAGNNSNASSAVATGATNVGSVAYNYGFNGTTWDQLQVDASKFLKVNCSAGCSSGSVSNASSAVATSSTNLGTVAYSYGYNGTTWDQLQVDASKFLKVNCSAGCTGASDGTQAFSITSSTTSTALALVGTNSVQFNLTGVWAATVVGQISNDNSNWVSVPLLNMSVAPPAYSPAATGATANGNYLLVGTQGARYARVSVTFTSGTVAGTMTAVSQGPSVTFGDYVNYLQIISPTPAGTNIVGKYGIDQTTPGTTNAVSASVPSWAGGTLGAMANFGTTPGAVLSPSVNASMFMGTAIVSATNGLYSNLLQGNAVISATNGIYANALQGNAVLSQTNPSFASITDGTNKAAVKAANTAPTTSDPGVVANINCSYTNSPCVTLGQTTKSASVPMAIASDQVGTAGTANATVTTVQGIASMTPIASNQTQVNGATLSVTNPSFTEITDGSNGAAAVKPASTAVVAADKALVVAVSPNAPVPTNLQQILGNSASVGTGIAGTGTQRVTLSNTDPCMSPDIAKSSVAISVATATTTSLVSVSGSTTVYVCGFSMTIAPSATSAATAAFEYGTSTTCTGPTLLTGTFGNGDLTSAVPVTNVRYGPGSTVFKSAASNGVCILTAGTAVSVQGVLTYVQQ